MNFVTAKIWVFPPQEHKIGNDGMNHMLNVLGSILTEPPNVIKGLGASSAPQT